MNPNVLRAYLVSLGFQINQPSLTKFSGSLKEASELVEAHTGKIAGALIGAQAAITGAFTTISGAVLGLADHVAMADQQYRLFGLHMFMSTDEARKLTIATDALGVSLNTMLWDPETHSRALIIFGDIDRLKAQLGPDFEDNMKRIRDLRFEFTELGIKMKFLSMDFVNELFKKFGFTVGDVEGKLKQLNEWFEAHIPEIADRLSSDMVPVMRETYLMLEGIGQMMAMVGRQFTDMVADLSGDDALKGASFNFHQLAGAVEHVVHWMAVFVQTMTVVEKILLHVLKALGYAFFGHFILAAREVGAGLSDITKEAGAVLGGIGGGTLGGVAGGTAGTMLGAAIGTAVFPGIGTVAGTAIGAALGGIGTAVGVGLGGAAGAGVGYGAGAAKEAVFGANENEIGGLRATEAMPLHASGSPDQAAIRAFALAQKVGAQTGIDPKLLWEQWAHETGNFTNRGSRDLNNFAGIRYPGSTDYRNFSSPDEFADYYTKMITGKRYASTGVLNARNEDEYASALKRGGYYEASLGEYQQGMKRWGGEYSAIAQRAGGNQSVQVDVGGVNVSVTNPGATPEQIHQATYQATTKGVRDALRAQTQLDLSQLSPAI